MEYSVFTLNGQVLLHEDDKTASLPPHGASPHLVTTDQDEAVTAIGQLVLAGYKWAGNDWLEPATFHCDRCGLPAEPNGQGGWRHAEPADEAACSLISGGGMLAPLMNQED
jgi:hypothetical protein